MRNKSIFDSSSRFSLAGVVVALLVLVLTGGATILAPHFKYDNAIQTNSEIVALPDMVIRIDSIYGERSVQVGTIQNYRVRIGHGAAWPIHYEWRVEELLHTIGNNIVHVFDHAGVYTIRVTASNRHGKSAASMQVVVTEAEATGQPSQLLTDAYNPTESHDSEASSRDHRIVTEKPIPEGSYYSWSVESNMSKGASENTVHKTSELGLNHVRLYTDNAGPGSKVYRVLVGQYRSSRSALRAKDKIVETIGRPLILMLIQD